jgi:hypothetical protein
MRRTRRLPHPDHAHHRAGLRAIGMLLTIAGGALVAIGLISFFGVFSSQRSGPPQYFWCAMVGMPVLGIGVAMLKMGYVGAVARYVASETTPVAGDAIHDLAHDTRDAVRGTARAIAAGVGDARDAGTTCRECGAPLAEHARFCDQCGARRDAPASCRGCGHANAANARFCAGCGAVLAIPGR